MGEFVEDSSEGLGVFKFGVLREAYAGEWAAGGMHGYGVYTQGDGAKYLGQFDQDQRQGKGLMIGKDK